MFQVKWTALFQRHCSDEVLLAYVDSELPRYQERRVKKHLGSCWGCRARLSELDEQAQVFARAFAEQTFPGPGRVAHARESIWRRVRTYEQRFAPAPQMSVLPRRQPRMAWSVAGAVCAGAVGLILWRSTPERALPPEVVLARTQETEVRLQREPLHQNFRVEVVQENPEPEQRVSHLEIWLDGPRGRFASPGKTPTAL